MSRIIEEWREVLGGRYKVSNFGRVQGNIKRKGTQVGRVLYGSKQSRGYLRITCNELRKCFYIHRLVAEAFLGLCPNGYEVNHKDGNKLNNNIKNLEYVTHKDNNKHAARLGLFPKGQEHHAAKLTENDVRMIRELVKKGKVSQAAMARRYNVQPIQVSRIVNYKRWKHVN